MNKNYYRLKKLLSNSWVIFSLLAKKELLNWLPDEIFLKLIYRGRLGKKLNLRKPKSFNEKMQWLKINDRNPLYCELVDKYEVRKYVASVIGINYLIPLLGIYDSFDEIDFNKLPDQFVLKCTHDSGGLVICDSKNAFDYHMARKKITLCMKRNFYYQAREWPYKNVKPRIICEKFLQDGVYSQLIDYKLLCFNGEVKCIFLISNRFSKDGYNVDVYDMHWNLIPLARRHHPNSREMISKPKSFDLMLVLAKKLTKDFTFMRVDFYDVNGQLYFGELTLYPGAGFEEFVPEIYDDILGGWIKLPSSK